uniref:Uncharacterized protein n=1 Tax=Rhizophora mucronata TaxID=61149 RepID=A0A2P2PCR8_RHIMU
MNCFLCLACEDQSFASTPGHQIFNLAMEIN